MNYNDLKKYTYTIKALQAKNYVVDDVIAMSIDDIKKLPLSTALINSVLSMKEESVSTDSTELKKEFIEFQKAPDSTVSVEKAKEYNTPKAEIVPEPEVQEDVAAPVVPEVQDEAVEIESEAESADAEVETASTDVEATETIERTISSPEDIAAIREALQAKELRTAAAYLKYLKTAVPDSILKSVAADVITNLCNDRVAEVKAK